MLFKAFLKMVYQIVNPQDITFTPSINILESMTILTLMDDAIAYIPR